MKNPPVNSEIIMLHKRSIPSCRDIVTRSASCRQEGELEASMVGWPGRARVSVQKP